MSLRRIQAFRLSKQKNVFGGLGYFERETKTARRHFKLPRRRHGVKKHFMKSEEFLTAAQVWI